MLFMSDKQNKSYCCTFAETSSLISMLQLLCAVALVRLRKTSSIKFKILPLSLWVNVSDGLTSQMFKLYLKLQFVVSGSPGRNVAPASPSRTVEMFTWYEWHATNLNICDTAGAKKCTLETCIIKCPRAGIWIPECAHSPEHDKYLTDEAERKFSQDEDLWASVSSSSNHNLSWCQFHSQEEVLFILEAFYF